MTQDPRGRQARDPRGGRPAPRPTQNRAPLSLEERQRRAASRREAEERAREERARERSLRRFRRRRLFTLASLLSLVIVVGYYAILMAGLNRTPAPEDAYPVQIFRAGEKNALKTYTVEETYFNGNVYLPLSALQEFTTVTQYGDHARRSLAFSGGDIASFDLGTPNCEINGVRVSLTAPVFLKDDVLYLPVDFFFRRMNCFEYTYSSALNANVLTYLSEITPALTAREMEKPEPLDESRIPVPSATLPPVQEQAT